MLDPRKWPLEWVEQRVADGSIAIFENDTAIIGVERRHYPGGLVELHCMFAAGALDGVLALTDSVIAAGRQAGCDIAVVSSRVGWARPLKDWGFRVEQQVIVKDLRDGD